MHGSCYLSWMFCFFFKILQQTNSNIRNNFLICEGYTRGLLDRFFSYIIPSARGTGPSESEKTNPKDYCIWFETNRTHMGGVSLSGILANQQRSGYDVKFKQPILFSFCSRKWLYEHQDHFEPEGLCKAGKVDFERPSWLCTRVYDERTSLPL